MEGINEVHTFRAKTSRATDKPQLAASLTPQQFDDALGKLRDCDGSTEFYLGCLQCLRPHRGTNLSN